MPSYKKEARETAFRAWRTCGQNMDATLRELGKKGYRISKPTLYKWKDDFDWEGRAARAEAEEQRAHDAGVEEGDRLLADLIKQKEKYDRFFESLGPASVDTQATYAYASLIKTIRDLQGRGGLDKASAFVEFMRELVDYLMENDRELANRFDEHIDRFVKRIKAKE